MKCEVGNGYGYAHMITLILNVCDKIARVYMYADKLTSHKVLEK